MLFQLIFDADTSTVAPAASETPFVAVALLIFGLLIVWGVIYVLKQARSSRSSDWEFFERERFTRSWQEIEQLAKQGSGAGRKLAIIEADKLVDTAMRKVGFPGETMAERMKVAEYRFPAIRQMWMAHKWRNQLVHEAHFSLSERQTVEALRAYHDVLRQMKVLL